MVDMIRTFAAYVGGFATAAVVYVATKWRNR